MSKYVRIQLKSNLSMKTLRYFMLWSHRILLPAQGGKKRAADMTAALLTSFKIRCFYLSSSSSSSS